MIAIGRVASFGLARRCATNCSATYTLVGSVPLWIPPIISAGRPVVGPNVIISMGRPCTELPSFVTRGAGASWRVCGSGWLAQPRSMNRHNSMTNFRTRILSLWSLLPPGEGGHSTSNDYRLPRPLTPPSPGGRGGKRLLKHDHRMPADDRHAQVHPAGEVL